MYAWLNICERRQDFKDKLTLEGTMMAQQCKHTRQCDDTCSSHAVTATASRVSDCSMTLQYDKACINLRSHCVDMHDGMLQEGLTICQQVSVKSQQSFTRHHGWRSMQQGRQGVRLT